MSARKSGWPSMSEMDKQATENDAQRAFNKKLAEEGRMIRRKQEDENSDVDGNSSSAQPASSASSRHNGGGSSGRSSTEPTPNGPFSSRTSELRDMRSELQRWREKADQALKASAQLDNENQLLRYELDLLKDKHEDLNDAHVTLQRIANEQKGVLAFKRNEVEHLTRTVEFCRQEIEKRDDLITEHGFIRNGGIDADEIDSVIAQPTSKSKPAVNGSSNPCEVQPISMVLLSKQMTEKLQTIPGSNLEERLNHMFSVQSQLTSSVEKLKAAGVEENRNSDSAYSRYESRYRQNGRDFKEELQNSRALVNEYKLKQQTSELQISSMKNDIIRLEGKIRVHEGNVKALEQDKDKTRQDYRKCQLQLRAAETELRDIKSDNDLLRRRIETLQRGSISGSQYNFRSIRESSIQR